MRGKILIGWQSVAADPGEKRLVMSGEFGKVVVRVVGLGDWRDYVELLTARERDEVARIKNDVLRVRHVVSRGLRRGILADCIGQPPGDLEFVEEEGGKPRVLNVGGWDFNISHSGDFVAVAVARGGVGVDIEVIRPVREMDAIVARYFHRDEGTYWRSLDVSLREEAFFVLWSAREAAMKCVGLGLARGLAVTRVDPAIARSGEAGAQVGDCALEIRRVEAPDGCVAVVAVIAPQ